MTRRAINVIEELTWDALEGMLSRIPNACQCEQCKLDIYTLALNKLQPHYVTGKRTFQEVLKVKKVEYGNRIREAIAASVEKVRRNPRTECQKRGYWVQSSAQVDTEYEGPRSGSRPEGPAVTPPPVFETESAPSATPPVPRTASTAAKYSQYGTPKRR